jgi:biotin transport system substrate-specific component
LRSTVQTTLRVVAGVVAVAVAARVTVTLPGTTVPQSAQTLAVLLVGAVLGGRGGAASLAAYLVAGGIGVPVFADGASVWAHLVGPTAGYLLGFVVGAWAVGRMGDGGLLRRIGPALGVMMGGHALILALGWARLSLVLGPGPAFRDGVAPFLVGGALKAAVAAGVVLGLGALRRRRTAEP